MAVTAKTAELSGRLKAMLEGKKKADKPLPPKAKGPVKKQEKPKESVRQGSGQVRRAATWPDSYVIRLTPKGKELNPKRGGTDAWKLYANYSKDPKGITVGKYVELAKNTDRPKAGRVAIKWDLERKYITVGPK
jgi:hypothetical protein